MVRWSKIVVNFRRATFHNQIEEEIGSAMEQPTSNKFDVDTKKMVD